MVATEYRIDGGAWQSGTGGWLYVTRKRPHRRAAGTRLIEYRSTDAAGNVETVKTAQVILG